MLIKKHIDALKQATDYERIRAVASEVTREAGCNYFLYAGVSEVPLFSPQLTLIGNYPPHWIERYEKMEYARIDPTVWHATHRVTPLLWRDVDMSDPVVHAFFQEAADNGIASGATLPLHSGTGYMAFLTFVSSSRDQGIYEVLEAKLPYLTLFGYHMHEAVIEQRDTVPQFSERRALSDIEKKCLMWAAEGKTAWEIGKILEIKERTVTFHLNNATHKLGAVNRQHAIACGVALGEIRPYNTRITDKIEF